MCLSVCVCVFDWQVDEALKIKNTDIAKELSLPPVKLHCSSTCLFLFNASIVQSVVID